MMGHKLVDCSASELTRVARDSKAQPAARRVAQHEIDRRRREGDGDPRFPGGIGCEYDDTLWATADSVSEHYRVAHGICDDCGGTNGRHNTNVEH